MRTMGPTAGVFVQGTPRSMSSNHNDGRLAHSKQFRRRVLHANTNRKPGGQMDPVQVSLHVRQARGQTTNHVCIGSHAETNALHYARKAHIWFGEDVDVSPHSGSDVL